jgi:hypothetical protein
MTVRGKTSVNSAESPQTEIAAKATCDGTGPMNFSELVPSGPLEAAAAIQTKNANSPTETISVITSRHLTTNESAIATESPCAVQRSRGNKK